MNNTLNLQGERLGLFNPITGLDNKSFAKVKKNVKRLIRVISIKARTVTPNISTVPECRAVILWGVKSAIKR